MNDTSTHSSIDDHSSESPAPPRSKILWFFIGMTIGAVPPLLLAGYFLQQFSAYRATLPPDVGVCGTPLLLPIGLVLFVAPITGLYGGSVGLLFVVITQQRG
ncbi:MAG: hypothetical protein K0U86_18655 [Planctomycetes bacterium]|nr:hypothetical protein [Planctomycetota bacterium]MCH9726929.1 hypothetical protein [Planctomycetota bacterium]MCH9775613.1 hypothetical protein [Planctomycetota bacterium]MCH9793625.1 hypothetical protein [Planctomycetota bacterium]MDF1743108.1 hypothetical protein [Gimesia sp.]